MTVLLVIDLLQRRHWVVAMAFTALAMLALRLPAGLLPQGPSAPRRLLLAADGRILLFRVDGGIETATAAGESQWIGTGLLLVLVTPGRRHRLFFGHGNLDEPTFAALRRRLRGAVAG